MLDYSDWVKLYTAAIAFLGLVSAFAFTGGVRFIENMVRALNPSNPPFYSPYSREMSKLKQRIEGYRIFCDFLLDALFGGGMLATIPLALVIALRNCYLAFFTLIWLIGLAILFVLWYCEKYRQFSTVFKGKKIGSLMCLIALVVIDMVAVMWIYFIDLSLASIFLTIFISKLTYPIIWMIIGLIWSPFSAYIKWIELGGRP